MVSRALPMRRITQPAYPIGRGVSSPRPALDVFVRAPASSLEFARGGRARLDVEFLEDARDMAVDRAHAVAAAADAHVLVVSAYNTGSEPTVPVPAGARREIYGRETALHALRRAVQHMTSDHVHNISTRMVPGSGHRSLDIDWRQPS